MGEDEIPLQSHLAKHPEGDPQKEQSGPIEAYGARVAIISADKPVRLTFTKEGSPLIVSLPLEAFQRLLKDSEKALRENGLSGKTIGNSR